MSMHINEKDYFNNLNEIKSERLVLEKVTDLDKYNWKEIEDLFTKEIKEFLPPNIQRVIDYETFKIVFKELVQMAYCYYVIEKRTKEIIGIVILANDYSKEIMEIHLGYFFKSSSQGKGYAFETIESLIKKIESENIHCQIIAGMDKGNKQSEKLISKLDFKKISEKSEAETIFFTYKI